MTDFKKVKVREIGRVVTGHTPPTKEREYYSDEYVFIKPTDMKIGERYVLETEEKFSKLAYEKYKKALIPPMATCVVTIGSLGKKLCLTNSHCFTNQAVNSIIPYNNYDNLFVYYLFRYVNPAIENLSNGTASGRDNVSKGSFENLNVIVPISKEYQEQIASVLCTYDDLIEVNSRRIQLLEETGRELYKEWFLRMRFPGFKETKFVKGIPANWEIKKLGEVVELAYGKALKEENRIDGKYPVYGSSGIVGTHNSYIVTSPGIIVGRKGNVGSVFWATKNFFPIDTAFFVKTKISLYYTFFNLGRQNFIEGDSAVPGLNRNQAYSNLMLVPSKEHLDKFDNIIKPIFGMVSNLEEQNTHLRLIRDRLLPRLVSGKLAIRESRKLKHNAVI